MMLLHTQNTPSERLSPRSMLSMLSSDKAVLSMVLAVKLFLSTPSRHYLISHRASIKLHTCRILCCGLTRVIWRDGSRDGRDSTDTHALYHMNGEF